MHIHQIEVVDYSDNCSCNDCSHIREMIQLEQMQERMLECPIWDFDEYPVTLTKTDMNNLLF